MNEQALLTEIFLSLLVILYVAGLFFWIAKHPMRTNLHPKQELTDIYLTVNMLAVVAYLQLGALATLLYLWSKS